ncbi:MAG TPA: cytochrome C oxidase subunit I [Burkholderiaceae bacterium]|nr:cytochrome C oxidase subunit I [Burkholderiaceae bacterium]
MLLAVIVVCAAPVIASYFAYYVIKPQTRTNYGALIDSRAYPTPKTLASSALDGKSVSLTAYKGKWVMLQVDSAACGEPCKRKLYEMRQLRLTQGKDMDRIERVWLITDDRPVETMLMREYDGTRMLRAKADALNAWLPADKGTAPTDHIYIVDPLGNLVMRFPKGGDPNKMKKDVARLLKASSIG